MIKSKVRRVGNSAVTTLTSEMLAILDVRGDDGGLRIVAHDPEAIAALETAEVVMDENRDLLAALA